MAPNNPLTIHGNEKTMNLNTLILTNIQSSPYFKVNLFELKTYHQVIDEIYYRVDHLEPWEKGSRKTAGQTGMCGGVRGVGAGGIVSSAYCLLYKLFTLKLTKKQLMGLLTHKDSAYIRALGFMYIRYTQNPADLWDWYHEYLEDEEELDVKAGGGHVMMIGEMIRQWMSKLEWYSTLFPRIPVPIQKMIEGNLKAYDAENQQQNNYVAEQVPDHATWREQRGEEEPDGFGEAERVAQLRGSPSRGGSVDRRRDGRASPPFDIAREMGRDSSRKSSHDRDRERDHRDKDKDRKERDHRERDYREKDYNREKDHREKDHKERDHREKDHREKDRKRHRSRSRDKDRDRKKDKDRERTHKRSRSRERHHKRSRSHEKDRRRSRSKDRKERRRSRSHDRHPYRSHDKGGSRDHRENSSRDHKESSFERDLRREKQRIENNH